MDQRVYVATSRVSDYVKVGVARYPKDRVSAFNRSTGVPFNIEFQTQTYYGICEARDIEQKVLGHFSDYNEFGEWLKVDKKDVIDYLKSIIGEQRKERPQHETIKEPDAIIELKDLPKKAIKFSNYLFYHRVSGSRSRYIICYVNNEDLIILSFNYLEQARFYLNKLKGYAIPTYDVKHYL